MTLVQVITVTTTTQTMSTISIPGVLAVGFIAALVLYLLGQRKVGIVLFGLMVIITPLSWYVSFAMLYGSIAMTITDILILSLLSSTGGIIIGVGLQYESGPKQST